MIDEKISARKILESLTQKQRDVLDHLIDFKTSKEIARLLEISPHTVDQRIQFSKKKLGATSRSDVASNYRRLLEICEPLTYEDSRIDHRAIPLENGTADEIGSHLYLLPPDRMNAEREGEGDKGKRLVPEIFDGRYGALFRIGAILLIAGGFVLVGLVGLIMFDMLSELFAS